MTGITNASTGISGGAILVVSCPANVSVTVSKGDKSYTKNSGNLGSATFKGLTTGTWTIVINGNGQTATRTIEIIADYSITIAFFSATIIITYPASSTCVVTNESGQTVASNTNTDTSAKTWTAIVNATGTYTVTATDGTNTKSQSVEITAEGQSESVALSYALMLFDNGEFADGYSISSGYITPAVDLTQFTTMTIVGATTNMQTTGSYVMVALYETIGGADAARVQLPLNMSNPSSVTTTLDVSSFSGLYYVSDVYKCMEKNGSEIVVKSGPGTGRIFSIVFT